MNINEQNEYINLGFDPVSYIPIRCSEGKERKAAKMKYQQFGVVAFLAMVAVCTAHIGGSQISLQNVGPQVYCGRTLARTLAMLCYDDEGVDKRSETGTMYNSVLSPYYREQEAGWPWIAPHRARTMDLSSRGKRFGRVVDECCDKPCSVNVLLTYC